MRRLAVFLPLVLLGCAPAGPFTGAAAAYAKVGADSSVALAAAPSLLGRSCLTAANVEYAQSRLVRLKFETEGIALPEGDYYLPWEIWLTRARPTSVKATSWKDYCGEVEQTGQAFSSAAGALGAYSAALGALASGGTYEGADLGKTVDGVDKIVVSVGKSASSAASVVGALGKALDKLVGVVLRERVERDIEGFVRRADPEVQSLIVALRAYVTAARVDVEGTLAAKIQMIATYERLTGLGAAATIAPCRVAAPAPPAPPEGKKTSPEIGTLRQDLETQRKALAEVCQSLDLLKKTTSAQEIFAFHALALATDEDARQTRLVLTGFEEVLGRLSVAHAALARAGQSKDTTDLQTVLGSISELVTQLGALQAGLAQTRK
ncbi:MAG: hypothetical protein ABJE95_12780 [Byssovorax sp.]